MASIITHTVLADKVWQEKLHHLSRLDFIIGTNFPDIRYLAEFRREKTHNLAANFSGILSEKNSFIAGMRFHKLVDTAFEDLIKKYWQFFPLANNNFAPRYSLALMLDEILYDKITDWDRIRQYFDQILKDELNFVYDRKIIRRWHLMHQKYLQNKPNDEYEQEMLETIGFSNDLIADTLDFKFKIKNNSRIIGIINNFYDQFDQFIYTT